MQTSRPAVSTAGRIGRAREGFVPPTQVNALSSLMRRARGAHPAPDERITLSSAFQLYPQPITRPSPPLTAASRCPHDFSGPVRRASGLDSGVSPRDSPRAHGPARALATQAARAVRCTRMRTAHDVHDDVHDEAAAHMGRRPALARDSVRYVSTVWAAMSRGTRGQQSLQRRSHRSAPAG
jgi:hypothetical protein